MAWFLGGLKWGIQEEIILWTSTTVHKCCQLALKVEEKNKNGKIQVKEVEVREDMEELEAMEEGG